MLKVAEAREELEQRNRLRTEADLSPISMAHELRKLFDAERNAAFEAFFNTSPLRTRVEAKLRISARRFLCVNTRPTYERGPLTIEIVRFSGEDC
jgi:hypothetical protein